MKTNKILYLVTDDNYKNLQGDITLLFALSKYSVGLKKTFEISEIPSGSYIYINRILDEKGMEELKKDLKEINEIAGFVIEDIGVLSILKELKYKGKIILYQSHFATNLETVNIYLEDFDSVIISTDLTEAEVRYIVDNAKGKVSLFLMGYIPVMYSRRQLLSNFADNFNIENKDIRVLKNTGNEFISVENDYGTVLYNNTFYDGRCLLDCDVEYFIINPLFLTLENQNKILECLKNNGELPIKSDQGFLNVKTIYRVKERS